MRWAFLDVRWAFLNGALDEGEMMHVHPPPGINLGLKTSEAMRLLKDVYGWNPAPKFGAERFIQH